MLRLTVALHAAVAATIARRRDAGQTTAEYALVLLGAAAVALIIVTWATRTDRITRLLNGVVDRILSQVA